MSHIYRRGEKPNFSKNQNEDVDVTKKNLNVLQSEIEDARLKRLNAVQKGQGSQRRRKVAEVVKDDEPEPVKEMEIVPVRRERRVESSDDDMGALPLEMEVEDELEVMMSSSSSYETESSDGDDIFDEPVLDLKFVRKDKRKTLVSEDDIEAERIEKEEREREEIEERKRRTLKLMQEKETVEEDNDSSVELSSSEEDDEETKQKEFEMWKLRELRRIKREFEQIELHKNELDEKVRRQKMTDEEIEAENELIGRGEKVRETEMNFLQKYYHKGAFFVDEMKDVHAKHDYLKPTGMDKQDKTVLPAIMQVRRYGESSRSKYTHLTAEDTSIHDDYWRHEHTVTGGYESKLAGTRKLVRPGRKKRRVD